MWQVSPVYGGGQPREQRAGCSVRPSSLYLGSHTLKLVNVLVNLLGFVHLNILAWCLSLASSSQGAFLLCGTQGGGKREPEICDGDPLREMVVLVFILRRYFGEFLCSVLFSLFLLFSPETQAGASNCAAALAQLAPQIHVSWLCCCTQERSLCTLTTSILLSSLSQPRLYHGSCGIIILAALFWASIVQRLFTFPPPMIPNAALCPVTYQPAGIILDLSGFFWSHHCLHFPYFLFFSSLNI